MKNIYLAILLMSFTLMAQSQVVKLSGPRLGGTLITAGSGTDYIQHGNTPGDGGWNNSTAVFISQYGWQLETRFADGDEMVGLIEWVFLVGGMERGKFLPSISSLCGLRTQSGFEAALGPNISLSGVGMVLAVGMTIKTASLNIPVNLSFVPSKNSNYDGYMYDVEGNAVYDSQGNRLQEDTDYVTGSRISLTLGFNLVK